jgi:hypothetical protein
MSYFHIVIDAFVSLLVYNLHGVVVLIVATINEEVSQSYIMSAITPIKIMVTATAQSIINLFFSLRLASPHLNICRTTKTILRYTDEELPILL